jgi:tRNA threonylcarbamoyladenosine biosynthesis protein TsaB
MGYIVGIDTASTQLDIGLLKDGEPVCSYCRRSPGSHAEHIKAAMHFVLQQHNITAGDIAHAGVVVGPGSFTGLRIGIAFMKGFFLLRPTAIFPVSSLANAANAWEGGDGDIAVAFEARNGQVFSARFSRRNGATRRMCEDVRQPVECFRKEITGAETVLVDRLGYQKSTIPQYFDGFAKLYLIEKLQTSKGLAAAKAAWENLQDSRKWITPAALLPRYMQESAAEVRIRQKRTN